jgi:hypothetical protein
MASPNTELSKSRLKKRFCMVGNGLDCDKKTRLRKSPDEPDG